MTRISKHSLKFCNRSKLNSLDQMFALYESSLNTYLNLMKKGQLSVQKFLSTKDCPECAIKHSRFKQLVYKNASEMIRGQLTQIKQRVFSRYKRVFKWCLKTNRFANFTNKHFHELNINYLKRLKFNLKNISIMLNENLFDIEICKDGEFDEFVRIFLPIFKEGKKRAQTICLPIKYHKHSLKFKDWKRKKSVQLQRIDGKYFLNFIYEKENTKKCSNEKIGIDLGAHKLIADSNGKFYGKDLYDIYNRLAKKQRGSKKYKRLLKQKTNRVNEVCNMFINEHKNTDIVCEDLKNVKHKSSFYKSVNNKLQYWSYRQVIDKLESLSESKGFTLIKVDPSYTSQTCSNCGAVIKANRDGEHYHCSCGLEIDADTNAAINILRRGVYCPSSQKT